MTVYLFKLAAAFIRSRVLRKNTRWPVRPDRNEAKALERLGEDIANALAEAEGYVGFVDANVGVVIGDPDDIARARKMRARLNMLREGVCHA